MPKRVDAQDTIDIVTGFLHRCQAEGWCLEGFEHEIDYYAKHEKDPKLPIGATVTIRLVPVR